MIFSHKIFAGLLAALPLYSNGQDFSLFSYNPNSADGPNNWANIEIDDNQCGGSSQSGIDIATSASCDQTGTVSYPVGNGDCTLDNLNFAVDPHTANFARPAEGACTYPSIMVDGVTYDFQAARIHSISEHAIDGGLQYAEMHMEFLSEAGAPQMIALRMGQGAATPDPHFQEMLNYWAASPSMSCAAPTRRLESEVAEDQKLRRLDHHAFMLLSMIPLTSAFYSYDGSLTYPPCTEGIPWLVAEEAMIVSIEQMSELRNMINNWQDPSNNCAPGTIGFMSSTARPEQPLNGRTITRICSLPEGPFPPPTPAPAPGIVAVTTPAPVAAEPVVAVPVPVPVPGEPVAAVPVPIEPVPVVPVAPGPAVPEIPIPQPVPEPPAPPAPLSPTALGPTLPPIDILIVPVTETTAPPTLSGAKPTQFILVAVMGLLSALAFCM